MIWARLLIAFLAVTATVQRSIRQDGEPTDDTEEHSYRADYDGFPDEQTGVNCTCSWRYLKHYEAKGCIAVQQDSCGCPVRFDCPDVNEIEEDDDVCYYKGVRFPPGARIETTNPCERCRCSRGPVVEIVCYPVECPEFQNPLPQNCHYVYEKNKCCPKETVCVEEAHFAESTNQSAVCEYKGRLYPLGARIYPDDDDPCEVCDCTEDWQGSNGPACYKVDCGLERKRSKLLEGCVPIYQENTCCPIDFYCAPDDEFISNPEMHDSVVNEDSGCMFGDKQYSMGQVVTLSSAADHCISCSCQVPPDFTCIHRYCKPSPNEKFCFPYYSLESCCPEYECMFGDVSPPTNHTSGRLEERSNRELEDEGTGGRISGPEGTCFETQCTGDRTCLLYQVKCGNQSCQVPTCLETSNNCPTPRCDSGCVVTAQDENLCVTCACGEEIGKNTNNLKCQMPHCKGQNCQLVGGRDGCPVCSCERECDELECEPGCNVVYEREGSCPKCVCEEETEGCPTPVCEHDGCRIENLPNGCPTCICDRGRSSNDREFDNISRARSASSSDQQQQQQQQQQGYEDSYEDKPEENSNPDDYGDVLVMSSSSSSDRKANLEAQQLPSSMGEKAFRSSWEILEGGPIRSSSNIIENGNLGEKHESWAVNSFGSNAPEEREPIFSERNHRPEP